jgi:hypothetical protein
MYRRALYTVGAAVAVSLAFAQIGAEAQGTGAHDAAGLAARAKPTPTPSPSPSPSSSTADSIHAFVAPTMDAACASPNSQAQDVQVTSDGGYVLAGSAQVSTSSTSCATVYDGWIGKVSSTGQVQWQTTVGCYGGNFYGLNSVQRTSDGGYIAAGGEEGCYTPQCASGGFGTLNCAAVVKLSSTGQLQWQQFYPGAFQSNARQIEQTSDGGYVLAGTTQDTSNNTYAWVAKLDSNGNAQWQRQLGGSCAAFAEADSVQQTADGGYILGGGFDYNSNCHAALLAARLDGNGNVVWQDGFAVGGQAGPNASVRATSDGGYVLAAIGGFQTANGSSEQAVLVKLNSNGTMQWQNRYDAGRTCYYDFNGNYTCSDFGTSSYGVRQTADGGYVLAGAVQIIDPSDGLLVQPAWLLKADASGNVQWEHDYYAVWAPTGHVLGSDFYGVVQAGDGSFIAVGYREYYNLQANEVWVVKTDSNGNVGACGEVHSVTTTNLNAGLSASSAGLPVATVTTAGENVTSAGGSAGGSLGVVQDC